MSKQNRNKRYKLESVIPAYQEATGAEGGKIEFEGVDGKVYTIPHPLFMDDETEEAMDDADGKQAVAEILLGDQYEQFIVDGNDVGALAFLFGAIMRESQEKAQKVRLTRS